MVVVEYRIGVEQERDFIKATVRLRQVRLRNGASRWSLFRDAADRLKWSEIYFVDSWYEHLRLLARLTVADRELIDSVGRLHQGPQPPAVRHAVSWRKRSRISRKKSRKAAAAVEAAKGPSAGKVDKDSNPSS
jgi:hypothetical protein